MAVAPVPEVTNMTFAEHFGNGTGRMDAGEIWKVDVTTKKFRTGSYSNYRN